MEIRRPGTQRHKAADITDRLKARWAERSA